MDRKNIQVVKKSLHDEDEPACEYWLQKSVAERFQALEFLKMQMYPGYDPITSRLQRVYRIIKRK